jgi:hypothetical protein
LAYSSARHFGCFLGQPLAVDSGEVVVANPAQFQERNFGGPLAKFDGCGGDGATECGAHLAQIGSA